jgi:spermidine synthase
MKQLLTSLRRLVSYAMPFTHRVQTVHSGIVEITLYQGRKTLDTAHANYSYGSLQRVLRYGIRFTQPDKAQQVLVLGMGGGSIVQVLRQIPDFTGAITAVEFGVCPNDTLTIICADAFAWVPTALDQSFDLIIIDLFLDLTIAAGLGAGVFWEHIGRVLQPGGYVVLNTLTADSLVIDGEPATDYWAQQGFEVKDVEVELLNLLYILRKPA